MIFQRWREAMSERMTSLFHNHRPLLAIFDDRCRSLLIIADRFFADRCRSLGILGDRSESGATYGNGN
jgi:hypothetical protein